MKKENNIPNQFSIQFVFVMLLFLIIVILSVTIILLGKNIYNSINEDRKNNYEVRVSLSYIANKIRQADKLNAVEIREADGQAAIVINESYDGSNYQTWIYYYDNCLYEILTDVGSEFNFSDGMKVLEVDSFEIDEIKDNLYKFSVKSEGVSSELVLSLYSDN